jgi:hypothetical protein
LSGIKSALARVRPGADPRDRILIAAKPRVVDANYDLVHIVVKPDGFTPSEKAAFRGQVEKLDFLSYYPATSGENIYRELIESQVPRRPRAFSIDPTEDDRPLYATTAGPFILSCLAFSLIGLIFLFGPAASVRPVFSWRALAYFAVIGCGYMMVEISSLLKLQLYLGRPVYALSVCLFGFLLSSGLGSACTQFSALQGASRALRVIVPLLVAAGLIYCVSWQAIFDHTLGLPLIVRALIGGAVVFPLAFLMGTFFPLGIRRLAALAPDAIPWAWAVNGCFAIFGIFGARVVAISWGFNEALLLGLGCYALVFLLAPA